MCVCSVGSPPFCCLNERVCGMLRLASVYASRAMLFQSHDRLRIHHIGCHAFDQATKLPHRDRTNIEKTKSVRSAAASAAAAPSTHSSDRIVSRNRTLAAHLNIWNFERQQCEFMAPIYVRIHVCVCVFSFAVSNFFALCVSLEFSYLFNDVASFILFNFFCSIFFIVVAVHGFCRDFSSSFCFQKLFFRAVEARQVDIFGITKPLCLR